MNKKKKSKAAAAKKDTTTTTTNNDDEVVEVKGVSYVLDNDKVIETDASTPGLTTTKTYSAFLFQRGNMALARLLIFVWRAGPEGAPTYKLLQQLQSTGYGQTTLKRAIKEGFIERRKGESERGRFAVVYNIITEKGKQCLRDGGLVV